MKEVLALICFIALVVGIFSYNMNTKREKWTYLTKEGETKVGTVQVAYKGVDITYIVKQKKGIQYAYHSVGKAASSFFMLQKLGSEKRADCKE